MVCCHFTDTNENLWQIMRHTERMLQLTLPQNVIRAYMYVYVYYFKKKFKICGL